MGTLFCGPRSIDSSSSTPHLSSWPQRKNHATALEHDRLRNRICPCITRVVDRSGRYRARGREIPSDAEGRPLVESGTAGCRSRRSALEGKARPEQCLPGAMRPRQRSGQGRRRLRRTATLFQGRRPGDGPGIASGLVHREAAGLRSRDHHQASILQGQSDRQRAGSARDLRRLQIERLEIHAEARACQGARGAGSGRGAVLSPPGPDGFLVLPRATPIPASASGCRACLSSASRRRRAR